jgi:hypothetical protein
VGEKNNALSSGVCDLFLFCFLLFCTYQVSGINSEREGEDVHVGLLMVGRHCPSRAITYKLLFCITVPLATQIVRHWSYFDSLYL